MNEFKKNLVLFIKGSILEKYRNFAILTLVGMYGKGVSTKWVGIYEMRENFRYFISVLGDFFSIGISVVGSILAGVLTGWFIDEKIFKGRTYPWATTICIILGAIGGLKNIFYFTKNRLKEKNDDFRNKQ